MGWEGGNARQGRALQGCSRGDPATLAKPACRPGVFANSETPCNPMGTGRGTAHHLPITSSFIPVPSLLSFLLLCHVKRVCAADIRVSLSGQGLFDKESGMGGL